VIRALLLFLACTGIAAAGEVNVERIRALIAQRNQELLFREVNSLTIGRELPEALEALAVEHYADPVARRPLLARLGMQIDAQTRERYPRYRSRQLFDLMHADLKAGRDPLHYAIRVVCTDLPVEAELTALLPALEPAAANEIVLFLGARRYAPAVPALQALHARVPYERNTNQMIEHVDWAYLQIGTPKAIQALLARLRSLGAVRDERAGFEVWNILVFVNRLPPGHPPAYAELDAALPAQLNQSAWGELVKLIAGRKEKAGIPRLVQAIAQSPKAGEAVDALLAVGEPADWRAGRAALERSALAGERKTPLLARLDAGLSDPGAAYARRDERERAQTLELQRRRYGEQHRAIASYKASDPARYGAEMKKLLQSETLRPEDAVRAYDSLAAFYRFTLRQPDEALALYAVASARRPPNSLDIAALGAADTLRFDKRDARKAIEHYRRAAASFTPPNAREARMLAGFKRWMEVEIAYLQGGRRFAGTIGADDMQTAFLWLGVVAEREPLGPSPDPAALLRLPPSQLQIGRALPAVLELPPGEMLPFFEKHDPAGYVTAAVLSFALAKEPSPYVKAAADTFFRTRGIHTPFTAAADPRFGTPEKTWSAFIAGAKKGDAAAVLACFTEDMRAQLEPLFKRMSAQELREMGASFVGFAMQDSGVRTAEAMIVRQQKDRRQAGVVAFVRDGAGWKIAGL
jgi:hypothetical protein